MRLQTAFEAVAQLLQFRQRADLQRNTNGIAQVPESEVER